MAGNSDYDDLLDGTVDDVKSDLEDYNRSELRNILNAEKQDKNRKTLKQAIRSRMKDLETEAADEPATGSGAALEGPRQLLGAGLVIGVIVTIAAAFFVSPVQAAIVENSPVSSSGAVDEQAIRSNVQQLLDQQQQRQTQQFAVIANRSENISASDLSYNAEITGVTSSDYGSLQAVTISVTGTVPSRTGGLQDLDQEQTIYMSADGQFLFSQPRNVQQLLQQQPRRAPQ